jgi:hypothetical protein
MPKVAPYHTNSQEYQPKEREVYHDTETCPEGKRIKPGHRAIGTGDKKRCPECDKAN